MLSRLLGIFTKRRLIIVGVLLLAFVGFRFYRSLQPKFEVQTAEATIDTLTESVLSSGEITATELSRLTFPANGKLAWRGVDIGETVSSGQAIAKLDTVLLSRDLQRARADLRSAEATVEKVLDDVKGNDDDETFSEKETRTIAEVARDKAFDAVVKAEKILIDATLTSPFDGVLAAIDGASNTGDSVLATTTIYTVVNPETVVFRAEVDEIDISQVKAGQIVLISLDAYQDVVIEGRVKSIGFVSKASSTGGNIFEVDIDLPEFDLSTFRVGLGGDAEFVISQKKNVLVLPDSAVVENDEDFVWVIENDRARKRAVELGGSSFDFFEIKSGVNEGDKIIDRPPSDLKDGDRVRIE